MSPADPHVYEAPATDDLVLNSFLGDPYDTSLHPLYVEHAARHV